MSENGSSRSRELFIRREMLLRKYKYIKHHESQSMENDPSTDFSIYVYEENLSG